LVILPIFRVCSFDPNQFIGWALINHHILENTVELLKYSIVNHDLLHFTSVLFYFKNAHSRNQTRRAVIKNFS